MAVRNKKNSTLPLQNLKKSPPPFLGPKIIPPPPNFSIKKAPLI